MTECFQRLNDSVVTGGVASTTPSSTNYIAWICLVFSGALGVLALCSENDLWGKYFCTALA